MRTDNNKPYARIVCVDSGIGGLSCGPVDLTYEQYDYQMDRPDQGWYCPLCGGIADFDDDFFEELHFGRGSDED